MSAVCAGVAAAAVVVYDDATREDFFAAASDLSFENFEAFLSETAFADIAPTITDFSLDVDRASGTNIDAEFNTITNASFSRGSDDPRLQNDVDGSTYALVGVKDNIGVDDSDVFSILFDQPITEFGADFSKLNDDDTRRSEFAFLDSNGNTLDTFMAPLERGVGSTRFFGFISDTPFKSISVTAVGGITFSEGFGLDNVYYSEPAPVPVPASLPLLAGGVALLGWLRRRRASA